MKTFDRDGKINFVDENNVLLGYNNSQDCCEHFGWIFTTKIPSRYDEEEVKLEEENYVFDINFFHEGGDCENDGAMATFKLVHKETKEEIYLTIFNYHNGYYSHGFTFSVDGVVKQSGYL